MTRINADISPEALTDQHLMAEWREIKMVPKALVRALKTKSVSDVMKSIPKKFCLNVGHVRHFYDKMGFLQDRYEKLTKELLAREYQIDATRTLPTDGIPYVFFKGASYTSEDRSVVRSRIIQRVSERPTFYRIRSKQVSPDEYSNIINKYI